MFGMKQKEFDKMRYEVKNDVMKHYYGYIEVDGKEYLVQCEGKFRKQAESQFKQMAAREGGKFVNRIHVMG